MLGAGEALGASGRGAMAAMASGGPAPCCMGRPFGAMGRMVEGRIIVSFCLVISTAPAPLFFFASSTLQPTALSFLIRIIGSC